MATYTKINITGGSLSKAIVHMIDSNGNRWKRTILEFVKECVLDGTIKLNQQEAWDVLNMTNEIPKTKVGPTRSFTTNGNNHDYPECDAPLINMPCDYNIKFEGPIKGFGKYDIDPKTGQHIDLADENSQEYFRRKMKL